MNEEKQAAATGGLGINVGAPASDDRVQNILDLTSLEQRSTEKSNSSGEFSVFQLNRAAEAAILAAASSLGRANRDVFQNDSNRSLLCAIHQAMKMIDD